ncbi:MAG: bifunctional 4-hydroxy-2-oxoglutarate aldolase/2-dehydro-3-deoxy-phosphogluconate aldolase [Endomicrobium sp.]|jgi:2-dehydro-3-deoxyphosphogluconate aldolase/(4S)-4-hydroxy-2-oxoglutarate aldolase|nr:bifunctional 4-hydroxy-2-oxoglutarate aldolase/2-dehydro-3-deoxy-phosphogluconate aldolase [Endomicrobium sp.]
METSIKTKTNSKEHNIDCMLKDKGVLAVIEIERKDYAAPTCEALLAGGICAIELALRTDAAPESIKIIKKTFPQMLVGAGTLISKGQALRVKELGADFALSPGYNPEIAAETKKAKLPFIPGIATPTEIEAAASKGFNVLKFFPAQAAGAAAYLKSIDYPYAYLKLKYVPLGGINEENLSLYASMPQVLAVGGTWVAPKQAIRYGQWRKITALAKRAMEIWNESKYTQAK